LFTKSGDIIDLGTLGGNESIANTGNNRGQIVGAAANAIPDPFSELGFATQTRAFLWQDGVMQDLGDLGGPEAFAVGINDARQVEGFSSVSSTPNPITGGLPVHPFLWENGMMRDLGTIGGSLVAEETTINERGQFGGEMTLADEQTTHGFVRDGQHLVDVGTFGGINSRVTAISNTGEATGFAQIAPHCPGGQPIGHAFLWRKGVKTDLGAIPGITDRSLAFGINSRTQIVGVSISCDFSSVDAFLWDNGGPLLDLNTLVPADSPLHLFFAYLINDRGEIAGQGVLPNGDVHGFLLIPCGNGNAVCHDAAATYKSNSRLNDRQRLAIRKMMEKSRWNLADVGHGVRPLVQRYHIPGRAITMD
jgi:probable HAF family extracellular repeat protein